jgi:hypothetical protein
MKTLELTLITALGLHSNTCTCSVRRWQVHHAHEKHLELLQVKTGEGTLQQVLKPLNDRLASNLG